MLNNPNTKIYTTAPIPIHINSIAEKSNIVTKAWRSAIFFQNMLVFLVHSLQ